MTTRRDFLKQAAVAATAAFGGTMGMNNFAFGQTAGGKTFVKVFMRGGADGLHLFPRYGDNTYYAQRPDLAIPAPNSSDPNAALNMGLGRRGMNPNLEPLMEIWDDGGMMVAPCTHVAGGNRSHFDMQRWLGHGARSNFIDGYLNRFMQEVPGSTSPLRGVVAGKTSMSAEMSGDIPIPTVSSQDDYDLRNSDFCEGCADNRLTQALQAVSSHPVIENEMEASVRAKQLVLIESIDIVQANGSSYTPNANGLDYSNSDLGRGLKLVAQLLKGNVPLEVAALDWNIGWDTHANQYWTGSDRFSDQNFFYHSAMRRGATDLLCFYRDMGQLMDDVIVFVGTEFGREVRENGSRGSDHGFGGACFAFGGNTKKTMADDVTNLNPENILDGRYMPVLTNYWDIAAEALIRHMGMSQNLVSTVFPGHTFTDNRFFV